MEMELTMASRKKTGGRPKKGSGPSKSDFIREKLKAGMSASDIVKAGAGSGMKIGTSLIYNVKGRMGGKAASAGKASTPPKPNDKPGPKPKSGKMSASDFVRSMPPSMKAKEITAAAKAKGIKVSSGLVYMVRSAAKRRGGSAGVKGRPGRKPGAFATGASNGDILAFKKLAFNLGLATARQALDELERGLAALLE